MTSQPEAQKLMCPLGCGGMTENTSTQAMPLLTVCASEPAPVRTDGRALRAAGARVHAQRCLQAVLLPMPQLCCDAFFIYARQVWLLQAEWQANVAHALLKPSGETNVVEHAVTEHVAVQVVHRQRQYPVPETNTTLQPTVWERHVPQLKHERCCARARRELQQLAQILIV